MAETTERDLIEQVEELLAKAGAISAVYQDRTGYQSQDVRPFLRRLVEEVKRRDGQLAHVLICSGSPDDCEGCAEAERSVKTNG